MYFTLISDNGPVDLLQAVTTPLTAGVDFTKGLDDFPAYKFAKSANVHQAAAGLVVKVPDQFSLLVTAQPTDSNGGYLFSIVNPSDTLVQLGIGISADYNVGAQKKCDIILYYSDHMRDSTTVEAARFQVPTLQNTWSRFALRIADDEVTLFLNCEEYEKQAFKIDTAELEFEDGSTLYIAQGGPKFGDKFQVRPVKYSPFINNKYI